MHGTYRARGKLRWASATLAVLGTLATVAVAYRLHRASELGTGDMLTSLAALLLLVGAMSTAWRLQVRKLRDRAQAAEWEAKRARREDVLLDGDEDRALWDSVPPASVNDDTCGIGLNVFAIHRYRYPRAG
jgi:type VI protein secretion system component VasK